MICRRLLRRILKVDWVRLNTIDLFSQLCTDLQPFLHTLILSEKSLPFKGGVVRRCIFGISDRCLFNLFFKLFKVFLQICGGVANERALYPIGRGRLNWKQQAATPSLHIKQFNSPPRITCRLCHIEQGQSYTWKS